MIHPSDVITLAQSGFDNAIREMAETYGFQENVVREVYNEVTSLSRAKSLLKAMYKAAQAKAEAKLNNVDCSSEVSESGNNK